MGSNPSFIESLPHRAAEKVVHYSQTSIDPQFEVGSLNTKRMALAVSDYPLSLLQLALFLKYLRTPDVDELFTSIPPVGESGGYLLTHVPELCMEPELTNGCATAYSHRLPTCVSL